MIYRVFTTNGLHCVRRFESLDEAQAWCWTRDTGHGYRIEWQYPEEDSPRRLYV